MKRRFFLIIFGLFCLQTGLFADSPTEDFSRGKSAFQNRLYSLSADIFQDFVDDYPSDSRSDDAAYYLGLSFLYSEDYTQALDWLRSFSSRYPESAYLRRIQYWIGMCYLSMGNHASAVRAFERQIGFIQEQTFLGLSYYYAGICRYSLSQFERAKNHFNEVSRYTSDVRVLSNAVFYQGKSALQSAEAEEAVLAFSRFLIDYPDSERGAEVQFLLGEAYYELERWEEAEERYLAFFQGESDISLRETALYKTGHLYYLLGRDSEAFDYLDLLLLEYPRSDYAQDAYKHLGALFLEEGEFYQALDYLNRIQVRDLTEEDRQILYNNRAFCWMELYNRSEAAEAYRLALNGPSDEIRREAYAQLIEMGPDIVGVGFSRYLQEFYRSYPEDPKHYAVGIALINYYQGLENIEREFNAIRLLVEDYPNSSDRIDLYFRMAELADQMGDEEAVLDAYGTALPELSGARWIQAVSRSADLLEERGRFGEALDLSQLLVERFPEDVESGNAYRRLASAFFDAGDYSRSFGYYTEAYRIFAFRNPEQAFRMLLGSAESLARQNKYGDALLVLDSLEVLFPEKGSDADLLELRTSLLWSVGEDPRESLQRLIDGRPDDRSLFQLQIAASVVFDDLEEIEVESLHFLELFADEAALWDALSMGLDRLTDMEGLKAEAICQVFAETSEDRETAGKAAVRGYRLIQRRDPEAATVILNLIYRNWPDLEVN